MDESTRLMVQEVAQEAAERAVAKALVSLGVDPSNPIETQKDMAALREWRELVSSEEFQRDMMHLRKWRKAVDSVQSKGMMSATGVIIGGLLAAAWVGIKSYLLTRGQ